MSDVTDVKVRVTLDARFAIAYLRMLRWVVRPLVPIIGPERALRLGAAGARRLMRYRLDGGRWRWLG